MIPMRKIRWRENFKGVSEMIGNLSRSAARMGSVWRVIFAYLVSPKKSHPWPAPAKGPVSVILVGGEFRNKGAQAMTFVAIDQVRRRRPDAEIHLFAPFELDLSEAQRRELRLNILPWSWELKRRLLISGGNPREPAVAILRGASVVLDISGYAFSSQWGGANSFEYLASLMVARRFGIPYFILPQSLGPFDYLGFDSWMVPRWLIRSCLNSAARIYAREKSGLQAVAAFAPDKVVVARDIVLMNPEPELYRIYVHPPVLRHLQIEPGAVGLIPSVKVMRQLPGKGMSAGYLGIVRTLLEAGRMVYVLAHAVQDQGVCRQIKAQYSRNDRVRLIEQELSAPELREVIRQFDFVVSSRYHGVIHALKQSVPALVLGWADKYGELMAELGQEPYGFDVRDGVGEGAVMASLRLLLANHRQESERIRKALARMTGENPFDQMGL